MAGTYGDRRELSVVARDLLRAQGPHLIDESYDFAVVGAGIVGLAHALAAARLGKRVIVFDRDVRANGASIRNFGFITVTGQARGVVWERARRSRQVWDEIAGPAGVTIEQRGLAMIAQRPEARAVLQAFLETEMGEGCRWLDADAARDQLGPAQPAMLEGVLISETDIRVESRTAVPAIARWLQNAWGVAFRWGGAVHTVGAGRVETAAGAVRAEAVVVCPGDDLSTLFPDRLTTAGIDLCKLQMLRLASPGGRLPAPIMSDLSLVRYLGYAALPEAAALKARLEVERAKQLAAGVHLIAVQGEDGGLVVGDSHAYAARPDPFASEAVDRLILDTFEEVFGRPAPARAGALDGHLCVRSRSLPDRGPCVQRPPGGGHQRQRRLHSVRPRRGSRRRDLRAEDGSGGMTSPIRAVVFDWAGTMIDFGCRAPVEALLQVFAEAGVLISETEARADMGRAKRDHIGRLLAMPRVALAWREAHGASPNAQTVLDLHDAVEPAMRRAARDRATLIPGAASLAHSLRSAGVKLGSCTGYTREMMADILPRAAEQGYAPDTLVCSGETAEGRPSPLMMWRALVELGAWPANACVKIDDAPVGIAEGRAAGAWTVGVAASGNGVGLTFEDLAGLEPEERRRRISGAEAELRAAGADFVVDSVADLAPVLDLISQRIAVGDAPSGARAS